MKETIATLAERYRSTLQEYFAGGGENSLQHAYELGRAALAEGLGVLDMVSIHHQALAKLGSGGLAAGESIGETAARRAAEFFSESVSPFEMALRGFQEANLALRQNLDELRQAEEKVRQRNEELEAAYRAVVTERYRYQEQFEFAPDGYLVTDPEGNILEANRAAAALLRLAQESVAGRSLLGFLGGQEQGRFQAEVNRLTSGAEETVRGWEIEIRPEGGSAFPAALAVALVRGVDGRPVGLRWLVRDMTEHKRAEEERARLLIREQVARSEAEAARRLAFLAKASTLLAGSLDYETTLANVAVLAVPYLADWCCVDVLEEGGSLARLAVVHSHSSGGQPATEPARHYDGDGAAPAAVLRVLRTGKPVLIEQASDAWLAAAVPEKEHLQALLTCGFRSAIVVPLVARGRTLGAITLLTAESGRRYDQVHLALAEDLAHRCALAVDNARLYREVIAERDRAEKANRAKDEFLAILSHELRNPLMPIVGWARVLKARPPAGADREVTEGIATIERNAQIMTRLVEDCLDLSRITEGRIRLEVEPLELTQVVQAAVEAIRKGAAAKGLELRLELASDLWVLGDRTRLEQVLMNLLANAVKYTDGGGVVTVALRSADGDVELEVRDTGRGIEPDFLPQLFQPFRRGTHAWLSSESGLGLGLAIAQQIVALHRGRISAESEGLGKGSTFRVRLPLETARTAEREAAVARSPVAAGSRRLLLIEDSRDILFLMKAELERLGYLVLTATDGASGLEVARRELPDVIVTDIKMPGMDGFELIRELRNIPELARTPVVALTGFGMKREVDQALAAGYDAHLTKPADAVELAAVIESLGSKREP